MSGVQTAVLQFNPCAMRLPKRQVIVSFSCCLIESGEELVGLFRHLSHCMAFGIKHLDVVKMQMAYAVEPQAAKSLWLVLAGAHGGRGAEVKGPISGSTQEFV